MDRHVLRISLVLWLSGQHLNRPCNLTIVAISAPIGNIGIIICSMLDIVEEMQSNIA
jgi:hypothetical protein